MIYTSFFLIWSCGLTHTLQENSGYVQHQTFKNHQLWFPTMCHTHTTKETSNNYLWKLLLIWSCGLTQTLQENSGYIQHQTFKNHQMWFLTMCHTHTGRGTQGVYPAHCPRGVRD